MPCSVRGCTQSGCEPGRLHQPEPAPAAPPPPVDLPAAAGLAGGERAGPLSASCTAGNCHAARLSRAASCRLLGASPGPRLGAPPRAGPPAVLVLRACWVVLRTQQRHCATVSGGGGPQPDVQHAPQPRHVVLPGPGKPAPCPPLPACTSAFVSAHPGPSHRPYRPVQGCTLIDASLHGHERLHLATCAVSSGHDRSFPVLCEHVKLLLPPKRAVRGASPRLSFLRASPPTPARLQCSPRSLLCPVLQCVMQGHHVPKGRCIYLMRNADFCAAR